MNVSVVVHWRKPRGGRIRTVTWIVWMIRRETNGNAEATLKYSQYGDLEKSTVLLKVGQNRITRIYCLISIENYSLRIAFLTCHQCVMPAIVGSVVCRALKIELSIQIVQPTGCVSICSIEACGTEYIF